MIQIQNISLSYAQKEVIADLSASIKTREFVALLGPNGAGKSTLLQAVSGQMRPESGQIEFLGNDIYQNNLEYKRQIGFVHETPFLYTGLTAAEFLQFVAKIKGADSSSETILELLQMVNLVDESYKLTSELSMGMRKKLAIAAALLGKPKIIFLDEALNGIDFESGFKIKSLLKTFVQNGGTIILSTHILEVVEKLCDRFLVLNSGKLVLDLRSEELHKIYDRETDLEGHLVEVLYGEKNSE